MCLRFLCLGLTALAILQCQLILSAAGIEERHWQVGAAKRTALVQLPSKQADQAPLVFVFHGHGGRASRMANKGFAEQWPEAIFVYPQGLPAKTGRDPQGTRSGWQNRSDPKARDPDLLFFDAMLEDFFKRYRIDQDRVYATGHSNGGGMTALLWANRHDKLAAVAISAGGVGEPQKLRPLPVMHLVGLSDPIVRPQNQQRNIQHYQKINQTESRPLPQVPFEEVYPSPLGCDVSVVQHAGGHQFLDTAPQKIVAFFKAHRRPQSGYTDVGRSTTGSPGGDKTKRDGANFESLVKRFHALDRNSDGVLVREEWKYPRLLQRFDADDNGEINLEEIRAWVRRQK